MWDGEYNNAAMFVIMYYEANPLFAFAITIRRYSIICLVYIQTFWTIFCCNMNLFTMSYYISLYITRYIMIQKVFYCLYDYPRFMDLTFIIIALDNTFNKRTFT